jgi:hypothetical protein
MTFDTYERNPLVVPLSPGSRALVVGGRAQDLPPELLADHRLLLWDLTGRSTIPGEVPQDIEQVFFTKFVSHAASIQVNKACAKRPSVQVHHPMLGTGQLKRCLNVVLGKEPPVRLNEVRHLVEEKPPETPKSLTMTDWVKQNIAENIKSGDGVRQVADRMWPLAQEAKVAGASFESFVKCIDNVTRRLGLTVQRRLKVSRKTSKVAAPVAAPSTAAVQRVLPSKKSEVLQMLDDAVAGLQLIREAVGTMEEAESTLAAIQEMLKKR